jgi:hypothetical protein
MQSPKFCPIKRQLSAIVRFIVIGLVFLKGDNG